MSRIGLMPISIPDGVEVEIKGARVRVKGPKGELEQGFRPEIAIKEEDGTLRLTRESDEPKVRALHGLTRALLNNMVIGTSEGFEKSLEVHGVGYRAELKGTKLVLNVGFSHSVEIQAPSDIQFEVDTREGTIKVSGIDKQLVGQVASDIRKVRPPEPYKGKGIRYKGEYVRRKAGKAGRVI
ncbi:MAG: 50S ribosomal protein L6 [Chloroflexi bacterium]|nr:50S ribosomal protein L6 [Chloroflexota bacterium]MCI0772045.1 50S ribosomal protein L6 [Chloroflexota bacterium]MCI0805790.1 50S ribosomal protein L6 [Chloroflexota bacterium]MCI0826328.1 50S ribosomal protein L6 [Chloroflexota bacterium]MCI0852904.1 50S ribosomal protein L6 [Chloroflexota bacterium]